MDMDEQLNFGLPKSIEGIQELCDSANGTLQMWCEHKLDDPCISVTLYNILTDYVQGDLRNLIAQSNMFIPFLLTRINELELENSSYKKHGEPHEWESMKLAIEDSKRIQEESHLLCELVRKRDNHISELISELNEIKCREQASVKYICRECEKVCDELYNGRTPCDDCTWHGNYEI